MKKKIESDDEDAIRKLYEPTSLEKLKKEDAEEKKLKNLYAPTPTTRRLSQVERLY
jgi:hypothetical protein